MRKHRKSERWRGGKAQIVELFLENLEQSVFGAICYLCTFVCCLASSIFFAN